MKLSDSSRRLSLGLENFFLFFFTFGRTKDSGSHSRLGWESQRVVLKYLEDLIIPEHPTYFLVLLSTTNFEPNDGLLSGGNFENW